MRVHSLELACRLSGSSTTRLDAPPLSWSLGYWTSVSTSQHTSQRTPLFQLWVDYSSTKSSIRQNLMLPKANLYQLHIYTSYWGGDRLLYLPTIVRIVQIFWLRIVIKIATSYLTVVNMSYSSGVSSYSRHVVTLVEVTPSLLHCFRRSF